MDEVKRWYIWNETDGCFYYSMKFFKGWWYLRILRWIRMTTLRDFLMRWFYEPFYGIMFNTAFEQASYDVAPEETKRETLWIHDEHKRLVIADAEEAKRLLVIPEETKRMVI